MKVRAAWLGACVVAWLAAGDAQAIGGGVTGRSGKQNGATCLLCHGALTRETQVGLVVRNTNGTPAVEPLQPQTTYELTLTARLVTAGNQTAPFLAGFDLAAGPVGRPWTGVFQVPPSETAWERVAAGEATHAVKRPSVLTNGFHEVTWRVLWKPPALPATASGTMRLFAAVRRTNNGDVRPLSAVSNGPNTALAPECGANGAAPCGISVNVAPTNCVDADGDGYLSAVGCPFTDPAQGGGDCNDSDATVFPGAPELCNNRDDNCDGQRDEGTRLRPFYPDADGDQWGDSAATPVEACDISGALQQGVVNPVAVGFDCDDHNAAINPAQVEVCDGIDQDCNGSADDGLLFHGLGIGRACDSPDDADLCARGLVACISLTEAGCVGDVPSPEVCDGANRDDNCDGLPDQAAFPLLDVACGPGVGCNQGIGLCNADGTGVTCEVPPQNHEICGNHRDDDCDGLEDEVDEVVWQGIAYGQPCDTVVDADLCKNGHVDCFNQRPSCEGDFPTPELCADGLDNDCDGDTDEADCVAVTPDAGPVPDAAITDSGVVDAAIRRDASVVDGSSAVDGSSHADSGPAEAPGAADKCGCSTAGETRMPWALCLVLWGMKRRRG